MFKSITLFREPATPSGGGAQTAMVPAAGLITSAGTSRAINTAKVTVMDVIHLAPAQCPKDNQGQTIPKSLLKLSDGTVLGILSNRIFNEPVKYGTGVECTVSYENKEVKNRANADVTVSNAVSAKFESTIRYVVAQAKAVSVGADLM